MNQSHLIISNAAILCMARVLLVFPQLILVPYLIGTIGEVGYGVYVLAWSFMMSIERLQQSLQSGVVKYNAGFLAQGLIADVNKVVSSSFVYSILLAFLVFTGTFITAGFYPDPSGQIAKVLVVVGVMVLFIFPLTPYTAVIESMQRYYIGAIAETVSKYLGLLAVMAWFKMTVPSVEALIIIMTGMLCFSRFVQVPFAYRLIPGLRNHPCLFDWAVFRLIAIFGTATALASLCLAVNSTGVNWLMAVLDSSSFVAHLAIMLMPGLLLSQLVGALTVTVMPATSAFAATGNQLMLKELLIRGLRYTTIFVLVGLLTAGLLMSDVVVAWVGLKFKFLIPFTFVLFSSQAFMLSTSIAHHMLKGIGKLRAVVSIYLVGLVIVPIGSILAGFHIWHTPYVVVTIGLATGHLVTGVIQLGICIRAIHADTSEVLMRAYVKPVIVASAVCPFVIAIHFCNSFEGLISRVCVSISIVLLFLTCIYLFIATKSEKQQVRNFIHLIWGKISAIRGISSHQS